MPRKNILRKAFNPQPDFAESDYATPEELDEYRELTERQRAALARMRRYAELRRAIRDRCRHRRRTGYGPRVGRMVGLGSEPVVGDGEQS